LKLPRLGFLSIVVLLARLLFGMAVSLWVTIGAHGPWSHISDVALFAAHGVLGAALLLLAFLILAAAFEESSRRDKASAATAFGGVIGGLCCGIGFVTSGGASGFSFGMAVGWVVALSADRYLTLPRTASSNLVRLPEGYPAPAR
jgi:hypothetical protein